jgi:2-(1,2-epoxy-1,2-dihydrophenyl)acetyl-CoA isomerase
MEFKTLKYAFADGVAEITLDRPDAANALDLQMSLDLAKVANHCDANPAVRAVILTAKGKLFCGGGDVMSFAAAGDALGELVRDMTTAFHSAISRFTRMNAPLVVAVNGTAAGAGLSMVLMGDIIVSAESAKYTVAYTGIGAAPDGSMSFFLPRLVGALKAKQMILMNPRLTAADALAAGLVTEVVADDQVLVRAREIARKLAAGPTQAHGAVKRLIADTFSNSLETQIEIEARGIAHLAEATHDMKEGVAAFAAKRTPTFQGK